MRFRKPGALAQKNFLRLGKSDAFFIGIYARSVNDLRPPDSRVCISINIATFHNVALFRQHFIPRQNAPVDLVPQVCGMRQGGIDILRAKEFEVRYPGIVVG